MTDKNVKIKLVGDDQASDDIKQVNKALGETGTEAKKANDGIKGSMTELYSTFKLVKEGVGDVYRALKQVYDFGKSGAEIDRTTEKFDRLSKAIGTTGDALLNDLKVATGGLVSDLDLMASATDFMALGLVKTRDEAIRLTSAAGQLGMDMNQLVLTLTNQTTMRFDALGVSVAGFDEKVQALKDSGMSANDAFNEAFLQQAEQQIKNVGSVTDSSISSFMKFEASLKNFEKAAKEASVGPIGGLVEILGQGLDVLSGNDSLQYKFDDLAESVMEGGGSYELYLEELNKALEGTYVMVDATGELTATTANGQTKLGHMRDITDILTESQFNAAQSTMEWNDHEKKLFDTIANGKPEVESLKDSTKELDLSMRSYNEGLLFTIASQGLSADEALILAESMGLVDERTQFASEKIAGYKTMLDNGQISVDQYRVLVSGLADALDRITDKSATVRIDYQYSSSGASGGGGTVEYRAAGGPVRPNQTYIVGENGPEMLQMGSRGGNVVPLTNVTNNYNLGVTTMQSANVVTQGFSILEALA